jgi:hypothetical protein
MINLPSGWLGIKTRSWFLNSDATGAAAVRAPRVNDKRVDDATGERQRFSSAILPAWCRKSPKITEVLPLLYLHGLSTQDFIPVLEGFLGTGFGLSAPTITRLTTQWQDDAKQFAQRDLSGVDYVYVWADGVVRHEALHDRVEVKDLHHPVVVAAG